MSENGEGINPEGQFETRDPAFVSEIIDRKNLLFSLPPDSSEFQEALDSWTGSISTRLTSMRGDVHVAPEISIIVPVKNETATILPFLESLARQDTNKSVEIVVVANNCSDDDRTAEIARDSGARVFEYNTIDNSKQPPIALARQYGLEDVKSEVVVSTDADAIAPTTWLREITQPLLDDPNTALVAGGIRHYNASRKIQAHDYGSWFARKVTLYTGKLENKTGIQAWRANQMAAGANMAFRRVDALKLGGYDFSAAVGEDSTLGRALSKIGKVHLKQGNESSVFVSPRRMNNARARDLLRGRIGGFKKLYLDEKDQLIDYRDESK